MKLSEIQAGADFAKVLILGPSGVGKTVAACTFPGKIWVADFDNKISSAVKFYEDDKALLDRIEVSQYGKQAVIGDPKIGRKPRMRAFLDDVQKLFDLHNKNQPLPYDTIVLDTITTFVDSLLEDYRYVSQTAVKRPNIDQNSQSDYGLLATHFKQVITGLLSLNANIVFTGHTELLKDETSGSITNEILIPGKMSSKLGIYFEEVYFAKIAADGKRIWQTKPDARTSFCRTQRKLPPEIPADYAEIVKAR